MAFDGAFLRLMRQEIACAALGARVDKIYMPGKNLLVLLLRSKDFAGKLLLSADPGGARAQLTDQEFENPAVPPMLCMLLRKKLVGARLSGLRQPGLERLLYLDFDTKNELGDPVRLVLAAELMGRRANLILCQEDGRVIDAVRRTDAADTTRILLPGVPYTPPPAANRFDLLTQDPVQAVTPLLGTPARGLPGVLCAAVPGLSPVVCRELTHRAFAGSADPTAELDAAHAARLTRQLQDLKDALLAFDCRPVMVADRSGKGLDYSFLPLTQYENSALVTGADTLSRLLDDFYGKREQKARMQAKSQSLQKFLNTTLARLARTVNVRRAELEKARNCEHLRKYGELLKSNLSLVPPGASVCRVPDYYDPECRAIDIPLSPALSPQQNAQKYFKDYRKQCTAAGLLTGLIEKGRADIAYLDSVADALSRAESERDLAAIEEELRENGWLKTPKGSKKAAKAAKGPEPYRFESTDGFTILAGRNNRQNDHLTLRQAAPGDLWFHAKNVPGSHVVVLTEGRNVPDTTLTQAAVIAATLSKAAGSSGVAVDYCPARRVKKPAGAAPGMVIYEQYRTAFVDPDESLVERQKKR